MKDDILAPPVRPEAATAAMPPATNQQPVVEQPAMPTNLTATQQTTESASSETMQQALAPEQPPTTALAAEQSKAEPASQKPSKSEKAKKPAKAKPSTPVIAIILSIIVVCFLIEIAILTGLQNK
jgi:cobalamin biosynthesis Mg chelatase CobN